jgi:hypothetical protein
MARPEAAFWDYLRGLLPSGIHYSRIESETSPGFPDIHYTLDGVSGTIELKSTKKPRAKFPFSGGNGLRKSQIIWIREETDAGGLVLLALECGKQIFIVDAGPYHDHLYKMTSKYIERVSWLHWLKRGPTPESAPATVRRNLEEVLMNKP